MNYSSYTRVKQQKRLSDRTEKGKCTNNRERRVDLSTLVKPFHTEHDPPDVIGSDNNTAKPLANSYITFCFIRDFFSLYQNLLTRTGL